MLAISDANNAGVAHSQIAHGVIQHKDTIMLAAIADFDCPQGNEHQSFQGAFSES